jgi:hypothetical protein
MGRVCLLYSWLCFCLLCSWWYAPAPVGILICVLCKFLTTHVGNVMTHNSITECYRMLVSLPVRMKHGDGGWMLVLFVPSFLCLCYCWSFLVVVRQLLLRQLLSYRLSKKPSVTYNLWFKPSCFLLLQYQFYYINRLLLPSTDNLKF